MRRQTQYGNSTDLADSPHSHCSLTLHIRAILDHALPCHTLSYCLDKGPVLSLAGSPSLHAWCHTKRIFVMLFEESIVWQKAWLTFYVIKPHILARWACDVHVWSLKVNIQLPVASLAYAKSVVARRCGTSVAA